MRLFNALTGREVKAIILREIAKAMDQDEQFASHLTYPLIEWDWTVNLRAFAQENSEFKTEASGKITVSQPEPVTVQLAGARSVTKSDDHPEGQAPDEARREAGLPVTSVEDTRVGPVEKVVAEQIDAFDAALAQKIEAAATRTTKRGVVQSDGQR